MPDLRRTTLNNIIHFTKMYLREGSGLHAWWEHENNHKEHLDQGYGVPETKRKQLKMYT
jgi:hypothetical protein